MLTAKEVADSFGLSINELAKITGYSRVSLYNIFNYEGKNANREEKLKKMYDILCQLNTKLEQQAVSEQNWSK